MNKHAYMYINVHVLIGNKDVENKSASLHCQLIPVCLKTTFKQTKRLHHITNGCIQSQIAKIWS